MLSPASLAKRIAFISLLLRVKLTCGLLPPSSDNKGASPVHQMIRSLGKPCSPVCGLKYSQFLPLKLRSHNSGDCSVLATRRRVCRRSIGTWAMERIRSITSALRSLDVLPPSSNLTLSSLVLLTRLMASLIKVSTSAECWRIGAKRASAAIFSGPSITVDSR